MAVKIKMNMPKSCIYCRFCRSDEQHIGNYCAAQDEEKDDIFLISFEIEGEKSRPSWCPLQ